MMKAGRDIEEWLRSARDYVSGVILFEKYKPRSPLVRRFRGQLPQPSEIWIDRLASELKDTLAGFNTVRHEPQSVQKAPKLNPKVETPQPSTPSPVTRTIPDGARELHKLHAYYHEKMRSAKSRHTRYKYARKIMEEIIPSLDALYQGRKSEEVKVEEEREPTYEELIHARKNIRSNVSKTRLKMERGRPELKDRLAEFILELEEINEKIKKLGQN